ncbi:MAG: hypothetical protein HYT39_01525 [Candidatus Sungbacteria bacterium]|nr:hypothetical protein [Candidatus Sungbacteria bacterium]
MFKNRFTAWVFLVRVILFGVSERIIHRWKRFVSGEEKSQYLIKREKARQQLELGLPKKGEGLMTGDQDKVLAGNPHPEVEGDIDEIQCLTGWTKAWCLRVLAGVLVLAVLGVVVAVGWAIYSIPK